MMNEIEGDSVLSTGNLWKVVIRIESLVLENFENKNHLRFRN